MFQESVGVNQPTEGWADVGELRMRYLDWGGDGPPLLALHGLASSGNWYDLISPLLSKDFRIVAPDQRGHGKTTQSTGGYDWHTLSQDIAGLMDYAGIQQAAVMGHSWGGHVASSVAAHQSQRVTKLIMIDGGIIDARLSPDGTWEGFSNRLSPRDVSGTREEFLERLSSQLSDCWNDELSRIVQTMVYEDESGLIRDILRPEDHAQVLRTMWDYPPASVLPKVTCPTLIIAASPRSEFAESEFAQMRRDMVHSAAQHLRNSRIHWVPDTIHDIGYHKPLELTSVIREFLSGP